MRCLPVDEFQPVLGLKVLPEHLFVLLVLYTAVRKHPVSILKTQSKEYGAAPALAGGILPLLGSIPVNLQSPHADSRTLEPMWHYWRPSRVP